MLIDHRPHHDLLLAAQRASDLDHVAGLHISMRLGRASVHVHLAAFAGLLRLGPRLEQARHVQPYVEADGFTQKTPPIWKSAICNLWTASSIRVY